MPRVREYDLGIDTLLRDRESVVDEKLDEEDSEALLRISNAMREMNEELAEIWRKLDTRELESRKHFSPRTQKQIEFRTHATGVKVLQIGPNYVGDNGGIMARIEVSIDGSLPSIDNTLASVVIDWSGASHPQDGGIVFAELPTILSTPVLIHANSSVQHEFPIKVWVVSLTVTGCTVRMYWKDPDGTPTAPTPLTGVSLHFCVVGKKTKSD